MNKRLLIFTGAGISADSGLTTFRDAGGLWEGHNIERVCNGLTWARNRDEVNEFYNKRRIQAGQAKPNVAHQKIAEWQKRYDAALVTQNVDGLLEEAGATSVLHVHGFLNEMKCVACGVHWAIGPRAWGPEERCVCGSRKGTRPNVVFFHEPAPNYRYMFAALESLTDGDVLLAMGTSGEVVEIGRIAVETKATTILSNLETSPSLGGVRDEDFDHVIHGRAINTVEKIDELLRSLLD